MTKHAFEDPGIAFAAQRLTEFAGDHGVATDRAATHQALLNSAGSLLMYGPLLMNDFDIHKDLAGTIPLAIERLAIYDHETPHPEYDRLCGVLSNRCLWLAVDNIGFANHNLYNMLRIFDASIEADDVDYDTDENGKQMIIRRHYFMDSDQYALQFTQQELEEAPGTEIDIMRVDFALPDRASLGKKVQ
ncbi:MAG: hypothetical protein JWO07_479 [Candidatus Saccharibacteria bacterium]|nr:hypothetical protein [Candidatus Saccharibacteria bacterium]